MKKKILALTLAAFTFGFVAANAQSTNNATCDKAQTECCKKEAKEGKRADRTKYDPFAGIELTQEQKAKLSELRRQKKADKEKSENAKKEARAKQQEAYNAEIAKILTPEQYQTYESNQKAMKEARKQKMEKVKGKMKARKHGEKRERINHTDNSAVKQ